MTNEDALSCNVGAISEWGWEVPYSSKRVLVCDTKTTKLEGSPSLFGFEISDFESYVFIYILKWHF